MKPGDEATWCEIYRGTVRKKILVEVLEVGKVRAKVRIVGTDTVKHINIDNLKPTWGQR
jgi:hypothetical protein